MNSTAKAMNEAKPVEEQPKCLQAWTRQQMEDGNIALAMFLKEASVGILRQTTVHGLVPDKDTGELLAQGMEIAFDLLTDRMLALGEQFSQKAEG